MFPIFTYPKKLTKLDIPHNFLKGANCAGMGQALYQLPFNDGSNGFSFRNADVDYLVSKGFNCVRLLISQETLQSNATWNAGTNSENNVPFGDFHAANFAKFKASVDYATSQGIYVIIGRHQGADGYFGKYKKANLEAYTEGITSGSVLCDFWRRMVDAFGGSNTMIGYSLDNEPLLGNSGPYNWWKIAQDCIDAIRRAGGRQTIFVAGISYQGASQWNSTPWNNPSGTNNNSNATMFLTLDDTKFLTNGPNLVAETHNYFSTEDSGAVETNVANGTIGRTRMTNVINWCNTNNVRVFVGEFGSAAGVTNSVANCNDFVAYIKANSTFLNSGKGCVGAAWWAYGSTGPSGVYNGWSSYAYTLSKQSAVPPGGTDSAQMTMLTGSGFFTDPTPPPTFDPYTDVSGIYAAYLPENYNSGTGIWTHAGAALADTTRDLELLTGGTYTSATYNATDSALGNQPSIGCSAAQATASTRVGFRNRGNVDFTTPITGTATVYHVIYPKKGSTLGWRRARSGTTMTGSPGMSGFNGLELSRDTTNKLTTFSSSITDLTPHIVCITYNGSSATAHINSISTASGSSTGTNVGTTSITSLAMGNLASDAFVQWRTGRLYVYSGVHTSTERGDMMTYLASLYSITLV